MDGEELKWRQLAHNDLVLVHAVQLKPMIKAQISGRMVSSGTSVVAFASVYSEKTRLKKLIMISFIMKKRCRDG